MVQGGKCALSDAPERWRTLGDYSLSTVRAHCRAGQNFVPTRGKNMETDINTNEGSDGPEEGNNVNKNIERTSREATPVADSGPNTEPEVVLKLSDFESEDILRLADSEPEDALSIKSEPENAPRTNSETEDAPRTNSETEDAPRTNSETEDAAKTNSELGSAPRTSEPEGASRTKSEPGGTSRTNLGPEDAQTTNSEPQPKRPSGAQNRRLKQAQKMAAGTWTVENPHKAAKRAAELEAQSMSKKPNVQASGVTMLISHTEAIEPPKTNPEPEGVIKLWPRRNEMPEGVKLTKAEQKRNQELWKAQKIAAGLWTVENPKEEARKKLEARMSAMIIHKQHPSTQLNRVQADFVIRKLEQALDDSPIGSQTPLQFNTATIKEGAVLVKYANEYTRKWIVDVVEAICNMYGADLSVVELQDLPKLAKVICSIPDKTEEVTIRTRLAKQNPDLNTDIWVLINRKMEGAGQTLTYSIDEESMKALRSTRFMAYYRLGKVSFKEQYVHIPHIPLNRS
ncbi:uncharacterized protein LOC114341680 [Diabrotica virgifera virgifera]|uniref:Uncharacterized protein LOC114341680 n=1 Tax=Diabrotica virgifera virgifera TaxID=50390 RepID=A0A6P7GFA8_DIAVI|nr:uncharacterized protein LOC114341680 [Diabrotica virgifera virgifera]